MQISGNIPSTNLALPAAGAATPGDATPELSTGSPANTGGATPTSAPTPEAGQTQWSTLTQALLRAGGSADARAAAISAALAQSGADGLLTQLFGKGNNTAQGASAASTRFGLDLAWNAASLRSPTANPVTATSSPQGPIQDAIVSGPAATPGNGASSVAPSTLARLILGALGLPTPSAAPAPRESNPGLTPAATDGDPALQGEAQALTVTSLRDLVARAIVNLTATPLPDKAGNDLGTKPTVVAGAIATAPSPSTQITSGRLNGLPLEIERAVTAFLGALKNPDGRALAQNVLHHDILQGTPALLNRMIFPPSADEKLSQGLLTGIAFNTSADEVLQTTTQAIIKTPAAIADFERASLLTSEAKALLTGAASTTLTAATAAGVPAGPFPQQLETLRAALQNLLPTLPASGNEQQAIQQILQQLTGGAATQSGQPQTGPTQTWQTQGLALELTLPQGKSLDQTVAQLREQGIEVQVEKPAPDAPVKLRLTLPGTERGALPVEMGRHGANLTQDPAQNGVDSAEHKAPASAHAHGENTAGRHAGGETAPDSSTLHAQRGEAILRAEHGTQHAGGRDDANSGNGRGDIRADGQNDGRFAPEMGRTMPQMAPFIATPPWDAQESARGTSRRHEAGTNGVGFDTPDAEPWRLLLEYRRIEVITPNFTYDDDYVMGEWPQSSVRGAENAAGTTVTQDALRFSTDGSDLEAIEV